MAGAGSSYQGVDEATEREHMRRAIAAHSGSPAQRPLGWYTGRDSPNTRRLVADAGGFEYDSDYYGDDLPFWLHVRRSRRHAAPHLVVPYTLDCNDMRFALPQGFSHGERILPLPARRLRRQYAEGAERAGDDERRHALPAARPAGAHARAAAFPRPRRRHTSACGWRAASTSRATGSAVHPFDAAHRLRLGDAMTVTLTLEQVNAATPARVRGAARRHLRAFAVDRRARLRAPAGRSRASPRSSAPAWQRCARPAATRSSR